MSDFTSVTDAIPVGLLDPHLRTECSTEPREQEEGMGPWEGVAYHVIL